MEQPTIVIIGLGYVGLPLAVYFAKHYPVIGIDIDEAKLDELQQSHDRMGEVEREALERAEINYTNVSQRIGDGDYVIVTVPTPVDDENMPDLTLVTQACITVGSYLKDGATVVFESTVYPGTTEEVCIPILERASGKICNKDFFVGYSPERVNPGDKNHTIDRVTKIVSGSTPQTAQELAKLYGSITSGNIHVAETIKIAEAAKITENVQRDVNIALMNELAQVYDRLGIDVHAVLRAAGTKWNFHKYHPGLVGGHCIGVDPYYLLYKAEKEGISPRIIRDARVVNDNMHNHYAQLTLRRLKDPKKSTVAILGLTFKANCSDTRNSRISLLIRALKEEGVRVLGIDPYVDEETCTAIGAEPATPSDLKRADVVIINQAHNAFADIDLTPYTVIDITGKRT